MPKPPRTGTAWARRLDDYAYTRTLDRPGWAWEFLRRNPNYCGGYDDNAAFGHHEDFVMNGVQCHHLERRSSAAKAWGLVAFACPRQTAETANVFWHPDVASRIVPCDCAPTDGWKGEEFDVLKLSGRRQLLIADNAEYLVVQRGCRSARLVAHGRSLISGPVRATFHVEGLDRAGRVAETLRTLASFMGARETETPEFGHSGSQLRDYLIALDGHLEGRSYRDIAQVLYGADRVAETWSEETRFLKDRVRRAVARGMELMNGGYRDLLQ
ncbi:MAG: DNA -binding domain-containing protein [Aestuariivirga sp.]